MKESFRPSENQLENPESGEKTTRRVFMKKVAALAAGTGAKQNPESGPVSPEKSKEEVAADTLFVEASRARKVKIDFTPKALPMSEEVSRFITAVITYQNERARNISADPVGARIRADLRPQEEEIWRLAGSITGRTGSYSRENLQRAFITDIPRALASYGILATLRGHMVDFNGSLSRSPQFESNTNFDQISEVRTETVKRWGVKVSRDVALLAKHSPFPQYPLAKDEVMDGMTIFQTIFVNQASLEADVDHAMSEATRVREMLKGKTDIEILRYCKQSMGKSPGIYAALGKLIAAHTSRDRAQEYERKLDSLIEHETGHVYEDQNGKLEQLIPNPLYVGHKDIIKITDSINAHEEIRGHLSELRYARHKKAALVSILLGSLDIKEFVDASHRSAQGWIVDKIVEGMLRDRARYGIVFEEDDGATPREHALLMIPDFVDKPQELEKIVDEIYAYELARPEEDFSQGHTPKAENYPDGTQVVSLTDVRRVATGLATLGGASLLYKLIERRKKVAQTAAAEKSKQNHRQNKGIKKTQKRK